ncbi:MAG: radical SAM protein [Anaerolineaceae bacterium]|nr:MAG: radical SAM protein [Anaerolineaceae bacterium]
MSSFLSRLLPPYEIPRPLKAGMYHWMAPDDAPIPYRLHLRVEDDETSVLIVNAATVVHLNPTATAHALQIMEGASEEEAAQAVARRYRVGRRKALQDQRELREQILTLATIPDVDPVVFLGMDRAEPFGEHPSAPYRLDLALTYRCDAEGELDPLARKRVDRELSGEEWKKILSTAWEVGIPHVTFTGGEPTLREDLRDLIEHAEAQGQVTGLLTDGRRLSDADYLETLSQAGLDHILITLVEGDPSSRKGLENAIASDIYTAVHLTLSPGPIGKSQKILQDLVELGVPAVSLSSSGTTDELFVELSSARDHAADLHLDLIWDIPVPYSSTNPIALELDTIPVGAGRAWLYVEPDGDVLPTQGLDQILGNLLRDPWSEIWAKAQS